MVLGATSENSFGDYVVIESYYGTNYNGICFYVKTYDEGVIILQDPLHITHDDPAYWCYATKMALVQRHLSNEATALQWNPAKLEHVIAKLFGVVDYSPIL